VDQRTPEAKYPRARYDIDQSPFYKLCSRRKLAALLRVRPRELLRLVRAPDTTLYKRVQIFKKGLPVLTKDGRSRLAEVPVPRLRRVHQRLLNLLSRIRVPGYLHCSVKKRSYVTNAAAHVGTGGLVRLDLRRFYPSVKLRHVYAGLINTFRCSSDVAYLIAKVCTYQGHIPTGSCVSGRLAYYAHRELFDSLHREALSRGLTLTLYGDDLITSGPSGVTNFTQTAKTRLRRSELDYRERGRFEGSQCREVTGVMVSPTGISLPNRRLKAILDCIERLRQETNDQIRKHVEAELLGRLGEADQIDPRILSRIANRIPLGGVSGRDAQQGFSRETI
jgi:RNA-directed DNA polymerase